jgi:hypothetical protein
VVLTDASDAGHSRLGENTIEVDPQLNAPVERQPGSIDRHKHLQRVVLVVASLIVLGLLVIAVIPGGRRAQPSFYATAAQVIPVLILALAVEHVWRPGWPFTLLLIVVAILVAGEFAAMVGTAYDVQKNGHTDYLVASSRLLTDMLEFFAVAGIGVGLTAVLWSTAFRPDARATSDAQRVS